LRSSLLEIINAEAAHLELQRSRRERESRERLAAALATLRLQPPPAVIQWQQPAPVISAVKPRAIYPTFEGLLTMIDCRRGITLVLRSADRMVSFHSDNPLHLEFISKTSNAANEAACGPVRPEHRVVVTYRRGTNGPYLGDPIRIEYR
jgi:hypothetical protein